MTIIVLAIIACLGYGFLGVILHPTIGGVGAAGAVIVVLLNLIFIRQDYP